MVFMKIILTAVLFFFVRLAAAQESGDSIQYNQGLPITGEVDTWNRTSEDNPPADLLMEIPKDRLPSKLLRTLRNEEEYRGWENFPIHKQRNTGLYILSITEGNTTRTYGFNKSGKPVTFSETTKKDQQDN
jgi:hypothetical protein